MPNIDLSILNQRQTPAFYADVFANRPAAGFVGRIFVSTNTFAFYRDNGTSWDLIGGPGTGTVTGTGANGQVTFWNGASTITGSNDLFWDATNGHLGVNTNVPGTALDVHHDQPTVAILNQTVATNDVRIGFQNNGVGLWRIGAFYNAGANDFGIYDAVAAIQPVTVKRTTGQVLIGTSTVGSGKLVVASTTGDNGVQIVGASAPSLRIDNAESGPTKRAGFGISTATNNFIQGSADRDFCMFNGSTTASPILFGIYDTTNVQEAARISASRNFLIGTTTDGGQKLQISGSTRATSYFLDGMTSGSGALYWTSNRVTLANYNSGGSVLLEVNGGANGLLIASDLSATFYSKVIGVTTGLNSGFNTGAFIAKSSGNDFRYTQIGYDNTGNYGWIQSLEQGTSYTNLVLNAAGGAVAINTTNPNTNSQLTLSNSTSTSLYFKATNTNSATRDFCIITNNNNFGDLAIRQGTSQGADATTGDFRLYISPAGNLLIGTTTDNGNRLQVSGNARIENVSSGRYFNFVTDSGSSYLDVSHNILFRVNGASSLGTAMTLKSTRILNLANVPTSSAGLVSGDVYQTAGVLNIVP